MTFERSPGPPAEAVAPGGAGGTAHAEPTPLQVRLQILTTEHWSLLASRGLAWNESFSRAGMFLSTLSAAIVALSLIGGVDGFHDGFFVVALIVLPIVLFVGVGTWLRMGAANYHDALTVIGMNRIRSAYLEIAPDLEPYFVMGVHDDPAGVNVTMAVPPGTSPLVHLIAGTPTLVMVLNGVVSGAIAALALIRFVRASDAAVVTAGVVTAIVVYGLEIRSARWKIRRAQRALTPMSPTPADDRATRDGSPTP